MYLKPHLQDAETFGAGGKKSQICPIQLLFVDLKSVTWSEVGLQQSSVLVIEYSTDYSGESSSNRIRNIIWAPYASFFYATLTSLKSFLNIFVLFYLTYCALIKLTFRI